MKVNANQNTKDEEDLLTRLKAKVSDTVKYTQRSGMPLAWLLDRVNSSHFLKNKNEVQSVIGVRIFELWYGRSEFSRLGRKGNFLPCGH